MPWAMDFVVAKLQGPGSKRGCKGLARFCKTFACWGASIRLTIGCQPYATG